MPRKTRCCKCSGKTRKKRRKRGGRPAPPPPTEEEARRLQQSRVPARWEYATHERINQKQRQQRADKKRRLADGSIRPDGKDPRWFHRRVLYPFVGAVRRARGMFSRKGGGRKRYNKTRRKRRQKHSRTKRRRRSGIK